MKKGLILLFVSCTLMLSAQESVKKDSLKEAIVNLYSQLLVYPQEKVYVQTDRPYYLSGEKIFFRAFLLQASKLTPSTISRYVYVELVSPTDTVAVRTKIRLDEDKMFYGALTLPESLPEGEYRIRSYTKYMENLGESAFYTRPVFIADPNAAKIKTEASFNFTRENQVTVKLQFKDSKSGKVRIPSQVEFETTDSRKKKIAQPDTLGLVREEFNLKTKNSSNILLVEFKDGSNSFKKYIRIPDESSPRGEITFYPEGGNLVAGSMNRVAFKALLPGGQALDIKGTVYNSRDEVQATFNTLHDGMGSFRFTPSTGETYRARCEYNGSTIDIKLPELKPNTLSLQTSWNGDSLSVSVLQAEGIAQSSYYLLIHRQGVPTYFQPWDFSKQPLKLSREKFNTGVTHLMLLTKDFQPVSERMIFNNRHDQQEVEMTTNAKSYRPREQVSLNIHLPNTNNDTVPATMAISVTDDKDVTVDTTTNILAEILLSSELEGHISNPAWYFGQGKDVDEAADLLMLTHGWRRYNVPEALQGNLVKPTIKPEASQQLTGVLKKPTGKPYKEQVVQIKAIGYDYSEAVESDEKGRFEFSDFEFPENTSYQLLSYTKDKTEDIEVCPDVISYPGVTIPSPCNANLLAGEQKNSDFSDYVQKANRKYLQENGIRQVELSEVTVKTSPKKKQRIENKVTSLKPDRYISPDDLKENPPATLNDLFYRIPGVIDVSEDGVTFARGTALIVVNGIIMDYTDLQLAVILNDIAQVDVYLSYGVTAIWNTNKPVIVITSWTPGMIGAPKMQKTNVKFVIPLGYQKPSEFYSPKYDTPQTLNSTKADLRSTIYWQPNLKTNINHSTSVNFYTADIPTTYSVVLEGIGAGRKLIYCRKRNYIQVNTSK